MENLITRKEFKNIDKYEMEYIPLWIYLSKCERYRKKIIKLEKEMEELKGDLSSYKLIHKIQCESIQEKVKQLKELNDEIRIHNKALSNDEIKARLKKVEDWKPNSRQK